MKTIVAKVMMFGLFVTMLASCKKDPSIPSIDVVNVKTDSVAAITAISAEASCSVYADCTERGVCWGKTANPTCDGLHVANGKGKGSYVCTMNELEPGQQYFCRAYGYDGKHYVYAREEKTFVTRDGVPVLTAGAVSEVALSSAKCTFSVTDDGGLPVKECGVCWGTEAEPTVEGQTQTAENVGDVCVCELSGLEPNSTYYVRPYAKNDYRVGYGAAVSFTTGTALLLPTVTTVEVTDVTATSATCTGNVSSDGGAEVTERGACWSTTENPTINGTHLASGSGTGSFTVSMTGLTPNATYYVCTYATNSEGTAYGEQKTFTTTEGLAVVTTGSVTEVTATSAKCGGNVTDQGASAVTERGICWSTAENPTTSGNHASSGTGTGSYTCSMTGLTPNATYYVRAYAINTQGTAYGSEVSFTALEGLPVVTTNDVTDITATSAKCGGNVTDQGGSNVTERGICWSTSHNPTTTDAHANSGTGGGSYTCTMTGLAPGTTYYVRAYAINGQGPAYGEEKQFTTPANKPTVTTNSITDITQTTATGGGNVTNDGGATVTERGICWGTSPNPNLNNSHASSGIGTGSFTCQMTDLTHGTIYYVRAYATNSAGTSYGSQVDFVTTSDITQPKNRNVILEDFTGRNSTYCPDAHRIGNEIMAEFPDRFWAINIQCGPYAPITYPNLNTTDGASIASDFSIDGYPSGTVNRISNEVIPRSQWRSVAVQQMEEIAECNIEGDVVVNPVSRVATITVNIYYTGNSSVSENYLTVAMIQDGIIGSQSGMEMNPSQVINGQYCHMHVMRDIVNSSDALGDMVSPTTTGTLITRTYTYEIPETIGSPNGVGVDLDNIYFIAFVSENHYHILNANKLEMTVSKSTKTHMR